MPCCFQASSQQGASSYLRRRRQIFSTLIAGQLGGGIGSLAASASGIKLKDPNEYYLGVLGSTNISDTLISKFRLKSRFDAKTLNDARIILALRSKLESRKDGLIAISFTDENPSFAATIANAYGEELMRVLRGLEREKVVIRRRFFEKEMVTTQTQLGQAENRLRDYLQGQKLLDVTSAVQVHVEEKARLEAEIFAKEVELRSASSTLASRNPEMQRISIALAALKARKRQAEASSFGANPGDSGLLGVGTEYSRLYRELKYRETLYEVLSKQYELAKLDEAKAGTLVQLIDSATPPEERSSPKRKAIVVVFAFLGVLLSFFIAFAREKKERIVGLWYESSI